MAIAIARSSFTRMGGMTCWLGQKVHPLNASKTAAAVPIQVAGLKATYGEKYPYPKPWKNWESRKYTLLHEFFDSTSARLNENSKIIVVDGNVGVGKNAFARRLAAGFDLHLIEGIPDSENFTFQGFDVRDLNAMLPDSAKFYDLERFLSDPNPESGLVGRLQLQWYHGQFMAYARALHRLLSTGQGFVMVRSPFTDNVYVDVCRKMGYNTPNFSSFYYDVRNNSLCELLKPHLCIYLDAPLNVIKERIKKEGDPREVNSKVLNDKYLSTIEQVFKEKCLPQLRETSEVLEIDWTEEADNLEMDVIIEEIQRLNLDPSEESPRFEDWAHHSEDQYCHFRKYFGSERQMNALFSRPYPWDCPEILYSYEDGQLINRVLTEHPAFKYAEGEAPELGKRNLFSFF